MASIKYPQENTHKGPWLLSRESFEELNEILVSADEKLLRSWNNSLEEQVNDRLLAYDVQDEQRRKDYENSIRASLENEPERKIEFIDSGGVKLVDQTLDGLLREESLIGFIPKTLEAKIQYGGYHNHSLELAIKTTYRDELDYKVSCSDSDIVREIKYDIEKWVEKHSASWPVRVWASDLSSFIAWMMIIPVMLSIGYLLFPQYSSYQSQMKIDAHQILDNGITEQNQHRALELIIAEKYKYEPNTYKKTKIDKDPLLIRLSLLVIIAPLIMMLKPKTTFGIGKRKNLYRVHKWWITFITITLPLAVVVIPFWEAIKSWLYP